MMPDVREGRHATVEDAVQDAITELTRAGVPSPEADAEWLAAHALGISRGELGVSRIMGRALTDVQERTFRDVVLRRCEREPLQHITGLAAFRGIELRVGPGVFVPRPETEGIVDLVLDEVRRIPEPTVLDMGTGSGAIAWSVAHEAPRARVWAVEGSAVAYTWAKLNLDRLGLQRARLLRADFGDAIPGLNGRVDVLVTNPPYIPEGMVPRDPEVRRYDPRAALYSGEDGLDAMRLLSRRGLALVREGGAFVCEHGEAQGAQVRALLAADGWHEPRTLQDLTGRDRFTFARLTSG